MQITVRNSGKTIIGLACLWMLAFPGKVQACDSLTISGKLKGLGNEKVSISFTDAEGKLVRAGVCGDNDVFTLRLKRQSQPVVARFTTTLVKSLSKKVGNVNYGNPAPQLELVVYQSDLQLSGKAEEAYVAIVKGDKENDEFEKYKKQVRSIQKKSWEVQKKTFSLDETKDSLQIKKLRAGLDKGFKEQGLMQEGFIKKYPASFASLILLSRMTSYYTTDAYERRYQEMADAYKQTPLAKQIEKRIEYVSPTAAGKPAIRFVKKDKDGKEISLEDYKGRVVSLDFWGSWCGPCRASHPHLKELYAKYNDKGFEIIAIASEKAPTPEEQRKKWLDAIEKDSISWVHILNNEEKEKQDIVRDYRITAFPTKLLLDKDGKILMRVTGGMADDVDKALERIYGY